MSEKIQLEIITPARRVLSEAVDAVTIPGENGEIGVLPGHTPLVSTLRTGVLSYTNGATNERLLVSGGFVEVGEDRVSVLADVAERADEIDTTAARTSREEAERILNAASGEPEEMDEARGRYELASGRLQLALGDASATPSR